jgi:hypothetical protein
MINSKKSIKLTILLSVILAGFAFGDAVQITEENDFFDFLHKNDNQYTQGANISYIHPYITSNGIMEREIFGITQKIYTPDNNMLSTPQPHDRPYCASLTGTYELWNKSDSLINGETVRQTFEVGVLGPAALGKEAQNGVHGLLSQMGRPNDPAMGWKYQLKNEPVANYYHERYSTLVDEKNGKWEFNLEGMYGGTVGTEFENAFVGTKAMFGYNLPQYKVLGGIYPKITKEGNIESETEWFIYGFAQAKLYTVLRDGTLGNSLIYGQESGVTPLPEVEESLVGLTVGWNWVSFSYAIGNRTKQFAGEKGSFDWGQVILTVGTQF